MSREKWKKQRSFTKNSWKSYTNRDFLEVLTRFWRRKVENKKTWSELQVFLLWRRVRDLNPRTAHHRYTISSRAPSTTQPTLHHYLVVCLSATKFIIPRVGQKVKHFFEKFCKKIRTAKNSSGKLLFKRIMPCESDRSSRKRRRRHRSARWRHHGFRSQRHLPCASRWQSTWFPSNTDRRR